MKPNAVIGGDDIVPICIFITAKVRLVPSRLGDLLPFTSYSLFAFRVRWRIYTLCKITFGAWWTRATRRVRRATTSLSSVQLSSTLRVLSCRIGERQISLERNYCDCVLVLYDLSLNIKSPLNSLSDYGSESLLSWIDPRSRKSNANTIHIRGTPPTWTPWRRHHILHKSR